MKITDTITIDPIVSVLPGSEKIPDLGETWPICVRRDAPQLAASLEPLTGPTTDGLAMFRSVLATAAA